MLDPLPFTAFDDSLAEEAGVAALAIPPTDGERLMRFRRYRDEAAFAEVVQTHAKMVWGVCSQILRHQQDVEDAFQATFLILARKAASIRAADNAAGWLYRVAFRTALLARDRRSRRNEAPLMDDPRSLDDQLAAVERSEQCFALIEELNALPQRYRQPLVLCYMEGRSRREAADEMGVTSQAVKGLLARGTRMLRSRLVRRGAALSTSMAAVTAAMTASHAAASPTLVGATTALGVSFALKLKLAASGTKGALVKGVAACTLAEKGIVAMAVTAASKPAVGLVGICLTVGMLAIADAEPTKKFVTLSDGGGGNVLFVAAEADDEAEAGADVAASADAREEEREEEEEVAENVNVDVLVDAGPPRTIELRAISSDLAVPPSPPVAAVPGVEAADPAAPAGAPGAMAISIAGVSSAGGAPRNVFVAAPAPMSAPAPIVESLPAKVEYARQFHFTHDPGSIAKVLSPHFATSGPASPSEGSVAALKLEGEYWDLKAAGLKKKAEALRLKADEAEALRAVGKVGLSESEALEVVAEAELTLAEVKLCEVNAQRVRDALEERTKAEKGEKHMHTHMKKMMEAGAQAQRDAAEEVKRAVKGAAAAAAAAKGEADKAAAQAVKFRAKPRAMTFEHRILPPSAPVETTAPQAVNETTVDLEPLREDADMAVVPKEELKRLLQLADEMEKLREQLKELKLDEPKAEKR
jgi:RNA polymerase sigma factor (sigma-70 family)